MRAVPYAPFLLAASLLFGAIGWYFVGRGSAWGWLFLYPTACFAILTAGYLGAGGAWSLAKRADGSRAWWGYVLGGPFLLVMFLGRKLLSLFSGSEAAFHEVAPGIYVGRRLPLARLPEDVAMVIDLTSEFAAPPCVRTREGRYLCLPTLDGSAPTAASLRAVLDRVVDTEGSIYVHCAAGHGRSAMLAAGLLVRRGHAEDISAAVALMQKARPGVRLMATQRRRAEQSIASL